MAKPTRKPLVSANWKMHLTHHEAINVVQKLSYNIDASDPSKVEISIHPTFTSLRSVQTVIDADDMPFSLGAQNVHWESSGAYTGEISPPMLAKLNVTYVIVGHSERRQYFRETDEQVAKKVKAVFAAGMVPIVCVGETLDEREMGTTEDKVSGQVHAALVGLDPEQVGRTVVAYEPIWAIGTGKNATPGDAQAVCAHIRSVVAADHGEEAASTLRVQYGGSVKAANAAELIAQPDIDGALVGGASLDPSEFAEIIRFARGDGR